MEPGNDKMKPSHDIVSGFALFELPLVALPTELIPLHIFEPRYLDMITRCLRDAREFGMIWVSEDDEHEIGCACRVEQIVGESTDGPIDIVARGTRPLRVIARESAHPHPTAAVQFLTDVDEAADLRIRARAQAAYAKLVVVASEHEPRGEVLAKMDAYAMAATVDLGSELKQGLLELRSENQRLDLVARLFRAATKRLTFVEEAHAKAKSNGKVHIV